MKTILVTGGAGFVGSHLALGLAETLCDSTVIALDNLKRRGSELNLNRLNESRVSFMHGDIRNPADLDAVGPIDLILECSAEPSVLAGYGDSPQYVIQTNLNGTINCLELARKHNAAMIFLSTSRVYPMKTINALAYHEAETRFELEAEQQIPGVSPAGINENFPLQGVRSLYGATKLCSEHLFQEYMDMYGLQGIINRCGILTGPWQMGKVDQGVVVLWAARHIFGGSLKYIGYGGQGKQVRDMLHIKDLLTLILHQIEHLNDLSGELFNVGGGCEISASLLELTRLCQETTGYSIPIESDPQDRVADIPWYITDNTHVTDRTGWQPQHSPREIMDDICRWIFDHRALLEPILTQ